MRLGFGLDLAGYSTGKSSLACALFAETGLKIVLLQDSPFSLKVPSNSNRVGVEQREGACLAQLLKLGNLAADVPIDLQGLPFSPTSAFVWGRTKRPVDVAVGGLPPLADKIGAIVSRFRAAVEAADAGSLLGERLFETYPAATFSHLGIVTRGYKSIENRGLRAEVCSKIGFQAAEITDDEIDAVICAITAIASADLVIQTTGLIDIIRKKCGEASTPKGYRLLAALPATPITIERQDYSEWMSAYAN